MLKVVSKNMFIDRKKVLDRLDKKRIAVLARTGGYTRTAMQRSMRKRPPKGKPSKPGMPPKANTNFPYLRDRIAYGLDGNDEVVVGPLARKSRYRLKVPELLNEGGIAKVVLPGGIGDGGEFLPRREETVRYKARPFATVGSPAFKAGLKKFLELTQKQPL